MRPERTCCGMSAISGSGISLRAILSRRRTAFWPFARMVLAVCFGEVKLAVGHLAQVADNEGGKLGVAEVAGFRGGGLVFGDGAFFGDIWFR